jgi:arginyl-tRNA synthetase
MSENVYALIRALVIDEVNAAIPGLAPGILAKIEVSPTREAAHGDMATNAAMVIAKPAGKNPRDVAAALAERLNTHTNIAKAEPAGPGFVNITLDTSLLLGQIPIILAAGEAYGQGAAKGRINVEYVSANPTGPLHVGHCRGAVVGDALANLLAKAGYEVTKEFYVNDAGAQVIALARSVYVRYLQALGHEAEAEIYAASVPGGMQYGGEYLVPLGQDLAKTHGEAFVEKPESDWLEEFRTYAVSKMLELIREDLAALGVTHDVFSSERELVASGGVERALEMLEKRGLLYTGTLEPPKGKKPEDWEEREQKLFRATDFGDDIDRPVQKSDGSNTYFANDIAYHADKMARGFTSMINVWGADHGGYVKRMKAAVSALSGNTGAELDILLCQIVRVMKDGAPVRMSKRAGTFVELRDLIDEVGPDAVRFIMLMRKSDAQMEFDLNEAVAESRDNPVYYVQYAHARCRSVLRTATSVFSEEKLADITSPQNLKLLYSVAKNVGINPISALLNADSGETFVSNSYKYDLSELKTPEELALIRRLITWPRLVEQAALAREPHRIAFYLHDLAADFSTLWNTGNADATLRFIQPANPHATAARLTLVAATATVLRSGLAVLGVRPVEEMR